MIVLRSALFNACFYIFLILVMLAGLPVLLSSRPHALKVASFWGRGSLWLLRVVAGVRTELRGAHRIPEGPLLVAAKHQSMWETFALLTCFRDPAFILKRELIGIPVFGWWLSRLGMIPIDRGSRSAALAKMLVRAKQETGRGRQILIFPEGTRRTPGDEPSYRAGTAILYTRLDVPCLPVALNSGLFWPRRSFLRHPGTIVMEFLDPIPAGLPRDEFAPRLQAEIEAASDRLFAEAVRGTPDLPIPPTARARVATLS